jgi:hypothetical protein
VAKLTPKDVISQLESESIEERRHALTEITTWRPLTALPHLLKVRRSERSSELQDEANNALLKIGAIIDLTPIGADHWFDQVRQSSEAFETLCDILGERFVGYALIAGVQITGLTIDQLTPSNTVVEYKIGDDGPTRATPLPQFRFQLVSLILSEVPDPGPIVLPLDLAQAQRLVGVRYILLAPLHNLSLKAVVLEAAGRNPRAFVVVAPLGSDAPGEEVDVLALRERINSEIQAELQAVRDQPFRLDLERVKDVEEAADKGEWEKVISMIGGWPGPLSLFLRTREGQSLDTANRARIGRALRLLASAYRAHGRSAWAEELYRLGLQFIAEGSEGANLFSDLGHAMMEEHRFGEAIGPLRRALKLGSPVDQIGPELGLAYLRQRRCVAAVAILEAARAAGCDAAKVLPGIRLSLAILGEAAEPWRALHEGWATDAELDAVPALSEPTPETMLDSPKTVSEVRTVEDLEAPGISEEED